MNVTERALHPSHRRQGCLVAANLTVAVGSHSQQVAHNGPVDKKVNNHHVNIDYCKLVKISMTGNRQHT